MAELSRMEKKEEDKLIESLVKKSYFSFNEINNLMQLYREHTVGMEPDKMDRKILREFMHEVFEIHDDILLDRIFKFFDTTGEISEGCISRKEWIAGLNIFLKGSEDEQIKYCFTIYDLNGDGYISREEMLT